MVDVRMAPLEATEEEPLSFLPHLLVCPVETFYSASAKDVKRGALSAAA